MTSAPLAPIAEPARRAWSIDAIIDERAIRTVFQPVVHLVSGAVVGFEALTRGPAGTALEPPLALLHAARVDGRVGELDWLCRAQAMQAAADADLPETLSWLINVESAGLAMPCPPHLRPALDRARADLRVILEVVERDLQGNVLELIQATDQARRDSWGVAVDDVGAEEGSLALLPLLRPDVVKLDMSLVRALPDAQASAITAAVRSYAERSGAVVLAEGIESEEHERLAKVFGATYGQGYYYGRPGPLPTALPNPGDPIPLRQHLPPLDGRSPFEILSTTQDPQRAAKDHVLHISRHLEEQAGAGSHASVLLAGFQDASFFTPATRVRYQRLAEANALTIVLADGLAVQDEPTYHIGPLPDGSRLGAEWVVIVLNLHYSAAFVARDCGDAGPDAQRRFDFIYTHSRPAVINAARAFIQDLGAVSAVPAEIAQPASVGEANGQSVPSQTPPARDVARAVAPGNAGSALAAALAACRGAVGFRATSEVVLNYLNAAMPMASWSITRVENDRQTHVYLHDNDYGLSVGRNHRWADSYCVHMVAGTAPRIAPDVAAIPLYAAAAVNRDLQIGAYAGAPIIEPDGRLFGAICGLDRTPRHDLDQLGPTLNLLSDLLTIALATDRALKTAERASHAALTYATTDPLTGLHNRRSWDDAIITLDLDFATFADPTVIVVVNLASLGEVNDGPGGRRAGDKMLRSAAEVLRRHTRDLDFVARLGGDEFGIIFANCEADRAPAQVERLTRALDRAAVPASAGWAALRPEVTVHHALDLADRAMHAARIQRLKRRTASEAQA